LQHNFQNFIIISINMASTSDIKNGMCIEMSGDTYVVKSFQHVKPGKGNAFVRMKLKSITTGKVIENTVPAGHKIDDVRVEYRQYQFLYPDTDNNKFNFMHQETFEQLEIDGDMIDNPQFLKEGMIVDIIVHAAKDVPLACQLPQYVVLEVSYIEPGAKGDTATNTLTPAQVETGAEIRVPLFIKQGDMVKIDTASGEYMERVNLKK
jgi:elongation factor P